MRILFTSNAVDYEGALRVTGNSAILSAFKRNALRVGQTLTVGDVVWTVTGISQSAHLPKVTNFALTKKD